MTSSGLCRVLVSSLVLLRLCMSAPTTEKSTQAEAIGFMRRFGYIDEGGGDAQALLAPDNLEGEKFQNAIKEVQRFGGLPMTGKLDSETIKLIATKRCGLPDVLKGSNAPLIDSDVLTTENPIEDHYSHHNHHHHTHPHHNHSYGHHNHHNHYRRKRYILASRGWDKRHLSYFLTNWPADLRREDVMGVMREALHTWGRAGNLHFSQTSDSRDADITFSFYRQHHGDPFPFDGIGNVLAHAFYPGAGQHYEGDVHFDDDEIWKIDMRPNDEGTDLYTVALHELGHSLGLSHSPESGSIMNPYYRGTSRNLGYDDKLAMYKMYASKRLLDDGPRSTTTPPHVPITRRPTWTTTQRTRPETTTVRRSSWGEHKPSDGCYGGYDTVAFIRNELFIIKGKKLWRLHGPGRIQDGYPVDFHTFFHLLPKEVKTIDAMYQREHDSSIIMFSGREYWVFDGNVFIDSPRSIAEYGLPHYVQRVDAATSRNQTAILFTKSMYWMFDDQKKEAIPGFPRPMRDWGLSGDVDSVLTYKGVTYFFKSDYFFVYDEQSKRVKYPETNQRASEYWLSCWKT